VTIDACGMLACMPIRPIRPLRSRRGTGALVATLATALLALGPAAAAGATTPAAKTPKVTIKNFAFSPKTLEVESGAKFRVQNKDGTTHTFTANKGAFDKELDGGSSTTVKIKKPGTYAYHCNIHPSMKGTIKAS
jgi:plastocyanin